MSNLFGLRTKCGSAWRGRFECRLPICCGCRRRHILREQRVMRQSFEGCISAELAELTISIGQTEDVSELKPIIVKARQDLKNRMRACRRRNQAWREVWIAGWWIVDAAPSSTGAPIWSLSSSAIVFKNELLADDLDCEFERQWRGSHRVVALPFPSGSSDVVIDDIVARANAHPRTYVDDAGVRQMWPEAWTEELYGYWCAQRRNVFEALRYTCWPQNSADIDAGEVAEIEIGPMPFCIT